MGSFHLPGRCPARPLKGCCVMTAVSVHGVLLDEGSGTLPEVGAEIEVLGSSGWRPGLYLNQYRDVVLLFDQLSGVVAVPSASRLVVRNLPPSDPTQLLLVRALAAESISHYGDNADHEAWKQDLAATAHAEADNRGWCSDFDDILEGLGLPRRVRQYRIRARFSGTVYVDVEAETADEACDRVTAEDVRSALAAEGWDAFEPEIDDVEEG